MNIKNKTYRKMDIFDAGIIFLISVTLFLIANLVFSFLIPAHMFRNSSYYLLLGVIEFLAIGLPAILYILIRKISIKKIFGEKISIEQGILSFFLAIFGYSLLSFLRFLWVLLMQLLKIPVFGAVLPPINTIAVFIVSLISISLIPAFSEEIIFRGIMQKMFTKKYKVITAIFISATFFALMHGDVSSLSYTFAAGLIMGFLAYYTNSLWPAIIYHATNNAIGVISASFISYLGFDKLLNQTQAAVFPKGIEIIITIAAMLFSAIISIGICILLLWALKKVTKPREIVLAANTKIRKIEYLPFIAGGFLLIVITLIPIIIEMIK